MKIETKLTSTLHVVVNLQDLTVWKVIPSFPNFEASNTGLIRNTQTGELKHQVTVSEKEPYRIVSICGKSFRVHRLVMEAFVGPSALEVNHKNGIKYDNRLSNLEYLTHAQNIKHAYDTGLNDAVRAASSRAMKKAHMEGRVKYSRGDKHYLSKLTAADIPEIRRLIGEGKNNNQIAKQFGVQRSTISQIRTGKTWKHVHQ